MTPTARLHFIYVVSILVAIIVALTTVKLANNEQVVSYVSFALTLASILLAVVATVYAFVSNASLAQSIGGLHQAASDVRISAASLDRLASGLENKVGTFTERVEATHELVRSLSNPGSPEAQSQSKPASPSSTGSNAAIASLVERSSSSGRAALYAAAVSFRTGRSFNRAKLFELLGKGNEDYYWGWLLALDAAKIVKITVGADDTWAVTSYPDELLKNVYHAAAETEEATPDALRMAWNKRKVAEIDAYFAAPAA